MNQKLLNRNLNNVIVSSLHKSNNCDRYNAIKIRVFADTISNNNMKLELIKKIHDISY